MDIKELNKSQLILLAVLLSFITSIATGITTVTLMQQAPVSFTAPVNRVIQQTVEKIQQVEGKTVTQTVVVKEEDLVVDAIDKNRSSVFSVTKETLDLEMKTIEVSAGRAFIVSNDGILAVDGTLISDKGVYYVKNDSGKFKADFILNDKSGFSFLRIGLPVNGTDKAIYSVPSFGDLDKMKVGQKVLVLGSSINSFMFDGLNANKGIDTGVTKSNAGSVVLNLDGEVLGMALYGEPSFVSIKNISNSLTTLTTKNQ